MKVTQAFELIDCPKRCPVRLYELYNSLCPTTRPDEAFYLRPLKKYNAAVWFESNPVGKNTLSDTVSRLCKAAGFVGFFSNHSLRAACATRLFDADVDEQLIKLKTGHASDAVRSYKRVAENKLESLTDVVACKCRKDDESLSPAASYCNEPAAVVNVDRPTGVDNASVPSINFGNISGDGIVIHLNINNSA